MRKVIQLATTGHENTSQTQSSMSLFALCNDGSMFHLDSADWAWVPVPDIPQPTRRECETDRICHALGGVICEAEV